MAGAEPANSNRAATAAICRAASIARPPAATAAARKARIFHRTSGGPISQRRRFRWTARAAARQVRGDGLAAAAAARDVRARPSPGAAPARRPRRGGVTIPLDPLGADERGPLPRVTAARGANPPLVVIDPGHGGHDPGAASPFVAAPREGHHAGARPRHPRRARRHRPGAGRDDPRGRPLSGPRGPLPDRAPARRRPVHLDPRRRRAAPTTRPAAPPSTPCPRSPPTARRPCSPQRENAADRIAGARLSRRSRRQPDPDRPRPAREHERLGRFRPPALPRGRAGLPVPPRSGTASPPSSC